MSQGSNASEKRLRNNLRHTIKLKRVGEGGGGGGGIAILVY